MKKAFENGRIIGDGCHRDLTESCEVCRIMFDMQTSRHKSELSSQIMNGRESRFRENESN